jgi:hypothetical protein
MKEDLVNGQIGVQLLDAITGLSGWHKIDADIKHSAVGLSQGQGQLLRPLVAKMPIYDAKEDIVGMQTRCCRSA